MWSARERTIIARTKQHLERSYSVKVRVEELAELLGPADFDVDFRRILKEARDERGREIFETFSSDGLSFLVAEWSRWQKKMECTMETKFVGLCKTRKSRLEFDRKKKGYGGSGRLSGKLRPRESGY